MRSIKTIILVALLAGCSTTAIVRQTEGYDGPDMIVRPSEGNMVRLTKKPCPQTSGWLTMNSADMLYEGKRYEACWFSIGHYVIVLDSNGDRTPLPMQVFKVDEGV